jgi:uncharacterized protein (TIGR00304 family)
MNVLRRLSFVLFIAGIICFALGVINGEAEVGFFLIFPFIVGSGILSFLGVMFLFFGVLLFIGGFYQLNKDDYPYREDSISHESSKTKVRGGGVVLIGPIPIVFGTSWKMTVIVLILAILVLLCVYLLFYVS